MTVVRDPTHDRRRRAVDQLLYRLGVPGGRRTLGVVWDAGAPLLVEYDEDADRGVLP